MSVKYRRLLVIPGLLVAGASCTQVRTATQIQTDRMAEMQRLSRAHLVHMVDNAMLQDMSIADHHFVGHTAEISGAGVARLDRFAPYLSTYGGLVRYETYCEDEALVEQRIEHVCEYLALSECDMDRVEVKRMISGGRGMPADEAVEIKAKGTAPASGASAGSGLAMNLGQQGS